MNALMLMVLICVRHHRLDGLEQPIRLLSGTWEGVQTRWSTIEKEAYAIYWAQRKSMIPYIWSMGTLYNTEHRYLLYLNNCGSRKVIERKFDIQHNIYNDTIIKHVGG